MCEEAGAGCLQLSLGRSNVLPGFSFFGPVPAWLPVRSLDLATDNRDVKGSLAWRPGRAGCRGRREGRAEEPKKGAVVWRRRGQLSGRKCTMFTNLGNPLPLPSRPSAAHHGKAASCLTATGRCDARPTLGLRVRKVPQRALGQRELWRLSAPLRSVSYTHLTLPTSDLV